MFIAKFQIDFKNKKSSRGYFWDNDNLVPVHGKEDDEVRYTQKTYSEFTRLRQYYKNTELMKSEGLRFCNRWGKFEKHEGKDYLNLMNIVHHYEGMRYNLDSKRDEILRDNLGLPRLLKPHDRDWINNTETNKDIPIFRTELEISYEWDMEGKDIIPTIKPKNLYQAIEITLCLCGVNPQDNLKKCLFFDKYPNLKRKNCSEYFYASRTDSKFCSEQCRVANSDQKKKNSATK